MIELRRNNLVLIAVLIAAFGAGGAPARGQIDSVVFGDAVSEAAHAASATDSEIIQGGLGLSARRLLPQSPPGYEGGRIAFSLKVDPRHLTYITFKFWGSDRGEKTGRLILFGEGKQIGYRHEGDYDVLNQADETPLYPGRFVYVTLPLPQALTGGRAPGSLSLQFLRSQLGSW